MFGFTRQSSWKNSPASNWLPVISGLSGVELVLNRPAPVGDDLRKRQALGNSLLHDLVRGDRIES